MSIRDEEHAFTGLVGLELEVVEVGVHLDLVVLGEEHVAPGTRVEPELFWREVAELTSARLTLSSAHQQNLTETYSDNCTMVCLFGWYYMAQ